jgi:REP element-mobilizing transposase RayT
MSTSEELPNRKDRRLKGWRYTSGRYFITCNTHANKPLFGAVINGRMILNAAGKIAEACWRAIPVHFPIVQIDAFVIMPNHVHGIVQLSQGSAIADPYTLGDIIGAYKSAVSRTIGKQFGTLGEAVWHRNYWDVIVKDEKALENIRNYIRFNPMNYQVVMQCGEPKCSGDRALLKLPSVGFLASRGEASPHGNLPLKAGEAILSGFLSPMERALFKAGLAQRKPMIWVKPWALEEGIDSPPIRKALEGGHLLILSPFADQIDAPSVRRAAWCNQYVLAHCTRMIIGHLNPDGMLACILSEAPAELEITTLGMTQET